MSKYQVTAPESGVLEGTIELPVSKSFMNRYITIRALENYSLPDEDPAYPDDVNVYLRMLKSDESDVFAGDGGTTLRFGLAVLSTRKGRRTVWASEQLASRPIRELVGALRKMGADITYARAYGKPPLEVRGQQLRGGDSLIRGNISSQFTSAALMVAPKCEKAVKLEIMNEIVSQSYVELTLEIMRRHGVTAKFYEEGYIIEPGTYKDVEMEIERDWSSAAFIYELCALSKEAHIKLPGLRLNSIQGDSLCAAYFSHLGVKTVETEEGIELTKVSTPDPGTEIAIGFMDTPDLVQAYGMASLGLGIHLILDGLINLHLKETDRIDAMKYNAKRFGGDFAFVGKQAELRPSKDLTKSEHLKSFEDHRMLMSMAPLSLVAGPIELNNAKCNSKSYPTFWEDLKSLGFRVKEIE